MIIKPTVLMKHPNKNTSNFFMKTLRKKHKKVPPKIKVKPTTTKNINLDNQKESMARDFVSTRYCLM